MKEEALFLSRRGAQTRLCVGNFHSCWKLQLNRQRYSKRRCLRYSKFLATQSEQTRTLYSIDDEHRARPTIRSPHVHWAQRARARAPTLLFSLTGCSVNRKPDFNPSWQWRDADTKIRDNSYPQNPSSRFKRFRN